MLVNYHQICLRLMDPAEGWVKRYDDVGKVPFTHKGKIVKSLADKIGLMQSIPSRGYG